MKGRKELKRDLDAIFSTYIRLRDNGVCFSCGIQRDPKLMQCGHFISRLYLGTRFCEINCHCQCNTCNVVKRGNLRRYAAALTNRYGLHIMSWLEDKSRSVKEIPAGKYRELIAMYKQRIKDLGFGWSHVQDPDKQEIDNTVDDPFQNP